MLNHAACIIISASLIFGAPAGAAASGRTHVAGTGTTHVAATSTGTGTAAVPVPTSLANARIARVLPARTRSTVLGPRFTMTVWDSATGRYLYMRRPADSLRGASTTKILTAAAVLTTLGPDHRMPTTVRAGRTADEVVLVAGGDPLLSSADLRALAASTALALTATSPSTTPATPTAAPTPPAAPTAPATPTAPPTPTPPTPTPPAPPRVLVRADDSLFPATLAARGWRSSYLPREVRPVNAFARDDRQVRDAAADAGAYFAAALRARGIDAAYAGEATAPQGAPTLAALPGHTIGEAVSRMLLVSDNDTAEMLFRHVALGRGLPATWAGARTAQAAALRELGVSLRGVRIIDGSGLSLEGRVTAGALTRALSRALSPRHPRLAGLPAWLPVAGRTGTLNAAAKRFVTAPSRCAAGLIQAKTGTVADAIGLAGYARGADGRTKVFVAIVNARPTRYSRLQTRQAVDRAASSVTGCW